MFEPLDNTSAATAGVMSLGTTLLSHNSVYQLCVCVREREKCVFLCVGVRVRWCNCLGVCSYVYMCV